jgi:hypothetical protein
MYNQPFVCTATGPRSSKDTNWKSLIVCHWVNDIHNMLVTYLISFHLLSWSCSTFYIQFVQILFRLSVVYQFWVTSLLALLFHCLPSLQYIENNTWVRGNTRFISRVEHDISRVSAANEWDIMFNTRNKYSISKQYFSVYYMKDSLWKATIFTEKR